MAKRYIYDDKDLKFRRDKFSFSTALRWFLMFIILSVSITAVYYLLFALVFNTKEESALIVQNRAYAERLPSLEEKAGMLSDEIRRLSERDAAAYREIFRTDPPELDMLSSFHLPDALDSIPDSDIVTYSAKKAVILAEKSEKIERNLIEALSALSKGRDSLPPLVCPIEGVSYAQIGASVGSRINPFYKVEVQHNGLDIISEADIPVRAAADGVVSGVTRSMKGYGNVVTITHGGGYVTSYAHLSAINVRQGMRVRQSDVIGRVGVSGTAYAPHLHYEVRRDTLVLNPVNHFFASVNPSEYVNMLVVSTRTRQSMD